MFSPAPEPIMTLSEPKVKALDKVNGYPLIVFIPEMLLIVPTFVVIELPPTS